MIDEQYARAKQILTEHKDGLKELAELLIEREVIFTEDVERIFGKRPWTSRADELSAESDERKRQREEEEKIAASEHGEEDVETPTETASDMASDAKEPVEGEDPNSTEEISESSPEEKKE